MFKTAPTEEQSQSLYNLKHWFLSLKLDISTGLDPFVSVFQKVYVECFEPDLLILVLQLLKDRSTEKGDVVMLNGGVAFKNYFQYLQFFPALKKVFPFVLVRLSQSQRETLGMGEATETVGQFLKAIYGHGPADATQVFNLEKVLIWLFKELSSDQLLRLLKLTTSELKDSSSGPFYQAIGDFQNSLLRLSPGAVTTVGSCKTKSFHVKEKEFSAR